MKWLGTYILDWQKTKEKIQDILHKTKVKRLIWFFVKILFQIHSCLDRFYATNWINQSRKIIKYVARFGHAENSSAAANTETVFANESSKNLWVLIRK